MQKDWRIIIYFDKFPKMLYDFNIKNKTQYVIVTDITRNMRVIKNALANVTLYDEYDMMDGETPEIVADKFYGSTFYHWVIMIVNDRYDYKNDFVLSTEDLEKYIAEKYGYTTIAFNSGDRFTIDVTSNQIFYTNHPFSTGDAVRYSSGTGNPIGGLVNGKLYYVIKVSNNQLKLATSRQQAILGNPISITALGTGLHELNMNNQYNVHHYEDSEGRTVNEANENVYGETTPAYPVSNYEYETRINEAKRRIKIVSPQLLTTILKNFNDGI